MSQLVFAILGMIAGAICLYVALLHRFKSLQDSARLQKSREDSLATGVRGLEQQRRELDEATVRFAQQRKEHEAKIITYKELEDENSIMRRDLSNVAVAMRKLEIDRNLQSQKQREIDERAVELGSRYLKENVKWISNSLNQNNYASSKEKLLDVIERCRGIGLSITEAEKQSRLADLKAEYEMEVRAAYEREQQARIKAKIREDFQREQEIQRELKLLERQRAAIQAALDEAIAAAHGQLNEEILSLQQRLKEAEERAQRAISQAQLTKAGFIYVISNIGAFGGDVFKIGMTRRLEPFERVRELSNASVPFPFDVHMMISCDDAPKLENTLHRAFHRCRINKTNPRKEFFKVPLDDIVRVVKEHQGEIEYKADAEALQYRQSLTMSEEDVEYIEEVFDAIDDEDDALADI